MSDFATYVLDRTIDLIQNRARDNEIRDLYDQYMSAQNYNNNDMATLVDVVIAVAQPELQRCRSTREEDAVIAGAIAELVTAHVGAFAMSQQRIVDSVPDDLYRELKQAAGQWEGILDQLSGRSRGMGGRTAGRNSYGSGGGRSVFATPDNRAFGARRSPFDRDDEVDPRQQVRASNSVFGGRAAAPQASTSPLFDRTVDTAPRSVGFGGNRATARQEEPAPYAPSHRDAAPQVDVRQEGPDMSKERPYDDFWINGEHWQIAHKSNWKWAWSPKQQTRRAYDIDQEVCFLVKAKDGTIREEFIGMTDDLVETAHEIRISTRPNRPRFTNESVNSDPLLPGEDIDAVDLDALNHTKASARKALLSELDLTNPVVHNDAVVVAGLSEVALRVAGAATKNDRDVTTANAIDAVQLAADEPTVKALESIEALGENDADLLVLQKRLKSLRGTMAENVLNFMDKHFTTEVNSALRDQFGLTGLQIDSFIEDFEDLLNTSTFKKNGTAYVAQFLSRTRILLAGAAYLTETEQRLEFLECSDILPIAEEDPEAYKQFREHVVVIMRPLAAVHVKIDSEQFGLVTHDVRTPSRTGHGADPVMVDTLNALYAIGRRTSGAGHVYVVTADNICFELVPIGGARDIVGIRLA